MCELQASVRSLHTLAARPPPVILAYWPVPRMTFQVADATW